MDPSSLHCLISLILANRILLVAFRAWLAFQAERHFFFCGEEFLDFLPTVFDFLRHIFLSQTVIGLVASISAPHQS
jgi:hypothetical protein